jgi:hypothetical protein
MTEEDCRADDERRRKKMEKKQNKTFLEWISDYLKEVDSNGREEESKGD